MSQRGEAFFQETQPPTETWRVLCLLFSEPGTQADPGLGQGEGWPRDSERNAENSAEM